MKRMFLLCLLALTGCQTNTGTGEQCGLMNEIFEVRDCEQERINNEQNACEAQKTWVEKAECKTSLMTKYRNDPFTQEISAYNRLIIEKVKSHKMKNAEADYAIQQKIAEVNQRLSAIRAQNRQLDLIERQQDALARQQIMERDQKQDQMLLDNFNRRSIQTPTSPPLIQNPERTECRPNVLSGGFDCTTY